MCKNGETMKTILAVIWFVFIVVVAFGGRRWKKKY
jgi:preprotein translocase subunit SecE